MRASPDPLARGAEVFARRWTPLILRELMFEERRLGELRRGVPRISPHLLRERLAELEAEGVVARRPAGARGHIYQLTPAGRELVPVILGLGAWAYRWVARDITVERVDPDWLMWAIRRTVRVDRLPPRRVVVRFELCLRPRRRYWLVLERPTPDLCLFDPGFGVDLEVVADAAALTRLWLGRRSFRDTLRDGGVVVHGPAAYRSALGDWLGPTRFAPAEGAARDGA